MPSIALNVVTSTFTSEDAIFPSYPCAKRYSPYESSIYSWLSLSSSIAKAGSVLPDPSPAGMNMAKTKTKTILNLNILFFMPILNLRDNYEVPLYVRVQKVQLFDVEYH